MAEGMTLWSQSLLAVCIQMLKYVDTGTGSGTNIQISIMNTVRGLEQVLDEVLIKKIISTKTTKFSTLEMPSIQPST